MPQPVAKSGIRRIKPHMLTGQGETFPPPTLLLHSNESAYGPSPRATAAARDAVTGIERYNEFPLPVLLPAIADTLGVREDLIAIGPGSDDLLARLARAYLMPGNELIRSANGYLKVPNYAYANDAVPVNAPDRDFTAQVDAILGCVTDETRMVYLANPDNPSGTGLNRGEVRRLHANLPSHVLLVLDCAYAEYVDHPDWEPAERLVEEMSNVVMTRTFSKIFGLAGARVGWLYGPPDVVDMVKRIGLTFPVTAPSLAACIAGLGDRDFTTYVRNATLRSRERIRDELTSMGLKVHPSQTNFVLCQFPSDDGMAEAAWRTLMRNGIATRRFASPAYNDCIRITLGHDHELDRALEVLERFLKDNAG